MRLVPKLWGAALPPTSWCIWAVKQLYWWIRIGFNFAELYHATFADCNCKCLSKKHCLHTRSTPTLPIKRISYFGQRWTCYTMVKVFLFCFEVGCIYFPCCILVPYLPGFLRPDAGLLSFSSTTSIFIHSNQIRDKEAVYIWFWINKSKVLSKVLMQANKVNKHETK